MIIDTFMFRDELDVLQLRLEEMIGHDVVHILAEAKVDFRGRPKPLVFRENAGRFAPWIASGKLLVIDPPELPDSPNPWDREHALRDALRDAVTSIARDDDLVLLCDVDEVPSRSALAWEGSGAAGLLMRTCHSAVDWLYPTEMPASVIVRAGAIAGRPFGLIRDGRASYPQIAGGGWHLSWLGGPEAQAKKAAVTCHLELPMQEVEILISGEGYRSGSHVGMQMMPVDVDDSWPAMIRQRRCPPSWFRPRGVDCRFEYCTHPPGHCPNPE